MDKYTIRKLEQMKKEAQKQKEDYRVLILTEEIEKRKEEKRKIEEFKAVTPYGFLRKYNLQTTNGVYFTELGLARLYMTVGYLQGKIDCKRPTEANKKLVTGFLRALEIYSLDSDNNPDMFEHAWEKAATDRYVPSVPKRMIAYTDDCSFGSFGFGLYQRTKEPNKYSNLLEVDILGIKVFYRFFMNGGLIYHSYSQSWSYHS
jgi:hypothetical protein